jgi:ATP-dependent DNA ligase
MSPQRPLEPMLARQVEQIPPARSRTGGWRYEPKWDGYRALVIADANGGVALLSRRGRSWRAFPEIVSAARAFLPPDTVLDGEIVCWSPSGRLDFGALQARNLTSGATADQLARETPAHLIAFDILHSGGTDLTGRPLSERRQALEGLFTEIPGTCPLALGLHTDDETTGREWFSTLAAVGVEGIVAKPTTSTYRPGDRSHWVKVKHYATAEAIVGGVTGSLGKPAELLVGRQMSPDGEFRVVGRTVPLQARDAAAVAERLKPADGDHPWPDVLLHSWSGGAGTATEYVKVDPKLVVEIRVDVATQADRWRHGLRFLRIRTDVEPSEVPWDLDTN